MNNLHRFFNKVERGSGGLGFLFILFLIIIMIFCIDLGYIFLTEKCMDEDIVECVSGLMDEEEAPPEGAVTATGAISGEFNDETHTVTVSMSFPLEGGAVTGSFTGDCEGSIKGTYAGGDGGAISGKGSGKCAFVVPASGEFNGTVSHGGKTVNINGTGRALGQEKSGSLTLSY
jgi:hypothetical protein